MRKVIFATAASFALAANLINAKAAAAPLVVAFTFTAIPFEKVQYSYFYDGPHYYEPYAAYRPAYRYYSPPIHYPRPNYYAPPAAIYYPRPVYGYGGAPATYLPPAPYGWQPARPRSCGKYRYWNGDYCADARYERPYVGPKW